MNCDSVVSIDTLSILIMTSLLNDIDVRFFDIGNSYLNTYTDDKVYFVTVKGFLPESKRKVIVVVNGIYGLYLYGALIS